MWYWLGTMQATNVIRVHRLPHGLTGVSLAKTRWTSMAPVGPKKKGGITEVSRRWILECMAEGSKGFWPEKGGNLTCNDQRRVCILNMKIYDRAIVCPVQQQGILPLIVTIW